MNRPAVSSGDAQLQKLCFLLDQSIFHTLTNFVFQYVGIYLIPPWLAPLPSVLLVVPESRVSLIEPLQSKPQGFCCCREKQRHEELLGHTDF